MPPCVLSSFFRSRNLVHQEHLMFLCNSAHEAINNSLKSEHSFGAQLWKVASIGLGKRLLLPKPAVETGWSRWFFVLNWLRTAGLTKRVWRFGLCCWKAIGPTLSYFWSTIRAKMRRAEASTFLSRKRLRSLICVLLPYLIHKCNFHSIRTWG